MRITLLSVTALFSLLLTGCATPEEAAAVPGPSPDRLTYHFTPPDHWMNDPNGMVYHDGEYHLFYQHYPEGMVWGPMHWGHAVSTDMVHWEDLPIALYPDSLGMIFSGSAVDDRRNTSGLGTAENPPLVAVFTHHDMDGEKSGREDYQYQSLAYSTDRGRSWTKYAGNPVIPNPGIKNFRDPKVRWDDGSQQWLLTLAAHDHIKIYASPNLIDWTFLSDFGRGIGAHVGVWECPDLFPMTSREGDDHWVLLLSVDKGSPNGGSGTQYFVGRFDGEKFELDPSQSPQDSIWLDYGRDNYAGVSWADIPAADGRRIYMGWMNNWQYARQVPTPDRRGAMTLPRTLELRQTPRGMRLTSMPVRETMELRTAEQPVSGDSAALAFAASTLELDLRFRLPADASEGRIYVRLTNGLGETYEVGYDAAERVFFSDRRGAGRIDFSPDFAKRVHMAPRFSTGTELGLRLWFDNQSAELFADEGTIAMTDLFYPTEEFTEARVINEIPGATFVSGTQWQLDRVVGGTRNEGVKE